MRRRPLRLAAVLLLILGLSIALASGCATLSTGDAGSAACPYVSCHNEIGYNQCVSAGCSCGAPNDFCLPKGQKPPPPVCPVVSCLHQEGYEQCTAVGCSCDPRTDACVPIPKG
ncbi:MAG: hypothetical protein ACJ76Y_03790 [Thermoanaerobaculia bacterium]